MTSNKKPRVAASHSKVHIRIYDIINIALMPSVIKRYHRKSSPK